MRCEPSSLHGGRQSGNSKRFDVYQNCSLFTEVRGKEEKEGQVDILQNAKFVFYLEFLEFVTTEKNRCWSTIFANWKICFWSGISENLVDQDLLQIDAQDCKEYNYGRWYAFCKWKSKTNGSNVTYSQTKRTRTIFSRKSARLNLEPGIGD